MDGSMHKKQTAIVSGAIGASLYRLVTSSLWILITALRSLLFVACAAFQLLLLNLKKGIAIRFLIVWLP
jgi:hypothetical protein